MRAVCPRCGRVAGGVVPKGGDGSAIRLRKHSRPDGAPCPYRPLVDVAETVDE